MRAGIQLADDVGTVILFFRFVRTAIMVFHQKWTSPGLEKPHFGSKNMYFFEKHMVFKQKNIYIGENIFFENEQKIVL